MNHMRNQKFAETNKEFILCCQLAEIKPTKRQASKFRLQKGKAWKEHDRVIRDELIKKGIIREVG